MPDVPAVTQRPLPFLLCARSSFLRDQVPHTADEDDLIPSSFIYGVKCARNET